MKLFRIVRVHRFFIKHGHFGLWADRVGDQEYQNHLDVKKYLDGTTEKKCNIDR